MVLYQSIFNEINHENRHSAIKMIEKYIICLLIIWVKVTEIQSVFSSENNSGIKFYVQYLVDYDMKS